MLLIRISLIMEIVNRAKLSLLCFSILLISAFSFYAPEPESPPYPPAAPYPPIPPPPSWAGWPPGPPSMDDDDYYVIKPGPPPPPPVFCNPEDRNTLLQIKQSLNNSEILSSWVPGTDCCNRWEYVGCDEATGRVIGLNFYGNGWDRNDLPQILPSAVGKLTYLEYFGFRNNVTGPIPNELANLTHLRYVYLSSNQFTGPIPPYFGQMQNLSWLELSGNHLTGPIPASLGNASNLNTLKLNSNRLTGHIPQNLHPFYLELSYNRLTGNLPKSYKGVNFRGLFLTGNRLTGDATFVFGKEKSVRLIDLSENRFSFNMSNVEIPPQLIWLGLSQNRIYGGLPPALTNNRLGYLNVSYNHLCGQIPQGGNLQQYDETAYFHNKCLCGAPLPPC